MTKDISQKPSEEFENAVTHAGSIMINCELCERVHIGDDENAIKESLGEKSYKKLEEDIKKNPGKYILHDVDMIPWGNIDGKQAVIGCPCNRLSLYENLFWNNRHIIQKYLSSRAEKELKEAKRNKNLADDLEKSIK
jgi:hypothetical protein